jgi:hypothetical protein
MPSSGGLRHDKTTRLAHSRGEHDMTQLEPFFRLDLSHEYFGTPHPPILILPDRDTARLASLPDLHMRRGTGWVEVQASTERGALRQASLAGDLSFTFRLREQTPNVVSVTAVLSDARRKLAVLDRERPAAGPLQTGQTLGRADLRPLKAGGLIEDEDVQRPPLAILRLRLDPEARDLRYTLHFGAAEQFLTYHVMGVRADAALGIRDKAHAVSFEALGEHELANGMLARSFRSSAPIPARARPESRFELVSEGPRGSRVLLSSLPSPRPGPGLIKGRGRKRPDSEIYLNLL